MYQVYVPPFEVLRELFPESTNTNIINGETIKGTIDHWILWSMSVDNIIGENRLITVNDYNVGTQITSIKDTKTLIHCVFAEYLQKLDWRPYGTSKTLNFKKGIS